MQITICQRKRRLKLTIVCDFIHVLEYLWKISHVFFDEFNTKQSWVKERLKWILNGKSSLVAAGARRSATRKKLTGKKKETIDNCANYLLNLSPYLKYHIYIQRCPVRFLHVKKNNLEGHFLLDFLK